MLLRSAKQQFRFSTANWSSFRVQMTGNRNRFAGFLHGNPSRLLPRICKNATSLITVPIRCFAFPKRVDCVILSLPASIDIRIYWYPPRRTLDRQDIYRFYRRRLMSFSDPPWSGDRYPCKKAYESFITVGSKSCAPFPKEVRCIIISTYIDIRFSSVSR